jgi:hypothetical protein
MKKAKWIDEELYRRQIHDEKTLAFFVRFWVTFFMRQFGRTKTI